jgi:hypothetical protein
VTPSWGDSGFGKPGETDRSPTWPRVLVLVGLLALAFVVAKGCQDEQVQVTQEEAIEIAKAEVDFEPTYTQVRLLRQGIDRQAFWFVSLSVPIGFSGDRPDLFAALSVVEIDSKTGEVTSVKNQSPEDTAKAKAEAKERNQDAEVEQKLEEFGNEPQESEDSP